MHLVRVQVPNFRGLNQVDITFEKDFFPRIFPLGSQNGGGKSTLLQLIFTLLHCSVSEERNIFLQDLLHGYNPNQSSQKTILAIFDIWDGSKIHTIEFLLDKTLDPIMFKDDNEKLPNSISSNTKGGVKKISIEERSRLLDYLKRENLCMIDSYKSTKNESLKDRILLCKIENLSHDEVKVFLEGLSEKVFLASHITQNFLFMDEEYRKFLSEKKYDSEKNDCSNIHSLKSKIPGFFTYDFLATNLVNQFIDAIEKDRNAIKEEEDSNYYETLLKQDINSILINKKINFSHDLNKITFKLDKQGQEVDLYPEDLSRGELKRLSIYTWLKHNKIKDAIVLMDEIEIALHPDWQYQIISDLQQWEPSNQYILATHSYELCLALTPAHVKEIELKLIKK